MIAWLLLLSAVLPNWAVLAQLSSAPNGTGCSMFGRATQFWMAGLPPGVQATAALWYSVINYYPGGGNNAYGWCIKNYELTPFFVNVVTEAIQTQVDNGYVNVPVINEHSTICTGLDTATCITTLIEEITAGVLQDLAYGSECMYPSDINGYLPTSYDCSFECLTGYVLSEGTCVLAPSGIARRQVLRTCPFGQTRCHAYGSDDGWECLGVSSHLESCGGCPGTRSSVDCTGLEGVHGVQCRRGACVVLSCAEAFELVGGECRAKGVLRWPQLQSQT